MRCGEKKSTQRKKYIRNITHESKAICKKVNHVNFKILTQLTRHYGGTKRSFRKNAHIYERNKSEETDEKIKNR